MTPAVDARYTENGGKGGTAPLESANISFKGKTPLPQANRRVHTARTPCLGLHPAPPGPLRPAAKKR